MHSKLKFYRENFRFSKLELAMILLVLSQFKFGFFYFPYFEKNGDISLIYNTGLSISVVKLFRLLLKHLESPLDYAFIFMQADVLVLVRQQLLPWFSFSLWYIWGIFSALTVVIPVGFVFITLLFLLEMLSYRSLLIFDLIFICLFSYNYFQKANLIDHSRLGN